MTAVHLLNGRRRHLRDRSVGFVELTEEQARERWRAAGHAEELIEILAAWQSNPPASARAATDTVERVTGRRPRTFADWAAEHAPAFGRSV